MAGVRKEIILLVDDVPGNLEVLANILESEYSIMVAKSGRKALEIANFSPSPNLILLDVVMPDLNGFDTCVLLKSDPRTASIPVIFVSSQTEVVDEARGLEVGGVDYLTKPVNPVIVRARVKTHLALSATARELAKQNQILQENLNLLEQIGQIASHDLKSPLNIFLNASDYLVQDKNLNPEQVDFLRILDASAMKMLTMIDRSLDLFKMERGQYTVKTAPVDLVQLIRIACRELESLAEDKTVRVSFLLNGVPVVETDTFLVQSESILVSTIVSNLVKNAIEASPDGETVIVSLLGINPFVIEVINRGVIPPQIQSRFFERYATYGKREGTGLGGYSAKLMTKVLGGDIRFASTKENGTTITVSIPFSVPQEVQASGVEMERSEDAGVG